MDFGTDQINSALDLVSQGGEATTAIANGVSAIRGIFQKAQKSGGSEVTAVLAELTQQVQNAKVANAELQAQLAMLKLRLIAADYFAEQAQRYERWEAPSGYIVRRLCEAKADGEPLHFACPACFNQRELSELQGYDHAKTCPRCKAIYRFEKPAAPQHDHMPPRPWIVR